MTLKALEYLAQTSDYTVTRVEETDWRGERTGEFSHYQIDTKSDRDLYAVVDDSGIGYFVRGGEGYGAYDAHINIEHLKGLIKFCETMTRGEDYDRSEIN